MRIESNNERDGTLSVFFSCGSMNILEGFGESELDSLGVGWEERLLFFCFPSSGSRFLLYVSNYSGLFIVDLDFQLHS